MKQLLIIAHPNSQGFAYKMMRAYIEGVQQKGDDYEIIDLYKTDYKQGFLLLNEMNRPIEDPLREHFQQKIAWADRLVFFFPLWWMDAPAILKNFLDMNLTSGFAYRYTKNGLEKLLVGKKVSLFVTAGARQFIATLIFKPLLWFVWGQGRMGYCGMSLDCIKVFGNFSGGKKDQERADHILQVKQCGLSS